MSAYLPAKRASFFAMKHLSISLTQGIIATILIAGLFSAIVFAVPARFGAHSSLLSLVPLSADHPSLVLKSARAERKFQFVSIVGVVQNVSPRDLRNAEAVVELLDEHGNLLRVESAMIGVSALSSGSDAPFKVTMRDADGSAGFRVRFRTLLGSPLPCRSQL